jgi:hypothetical protein
MKTELNMWTVKTSDSKGVVASGAQKMTVRSNIYFDGQIEI